MQGTACLGTEIAFLSSLVSKSVKSGVPVSSAWVRMDSARGLVYGPCIFGGMRKLYVFSFIHFVHS